MTDQDRRLLHGLIGRWGMRPIVQELARVLSMWAQRDERYQRTYSAMRGVNLRLAKRFKEGVA